MRGHIYISYFAKKYNNNKMTLCLLDCNFQFHISKLTTQRASTFHSDGFWDPQGVKGTMSLPLRVVKRKGKNKFNVIVTSMKTCAP